MPSITVRECSQKWHEALSMDDYWCPPATLGDLSQREREILRYMPSVLSAAEIGAELNISVNRVKAHLRSIYGKLGVSRRRDAVNQAHRHGLL
jgi:LuxR family maltose regulon positive regulatory protein